MKSLTSFLLISIICYTPEDLRAHGMRTAYLELNGQGPSHFMALWKTTVADSQVQPRFPISCETHNLSEDSGKKIFSLDCPGGLENRHVTIAGLGPIITEAVVRIEFANGKIASTILTRDHPIWQVPKEQSYLETIASYSYLGFVHIWEGFDHLLFLLALLLLVKHPRRIFWTATSFTLAHSITLGLSIFKVIHVSPQAAEACIALSLVLIALDLDKPKGASSRQEFLFAFLFGLVHGLGFANALREVGLPSHAVPLGLLGFNLGVEIGQLFFLSLVFGVFRLLRSHHLQLLVERVSAYSIGTTGSYLLIDRIRALLLVAALTTFLIPHETYAISQHCPGFKKGEKNIYFGDLHVHTSYSLDAFGWGTKNDPAMAYAFARGRTQAIPGSRSATIDRPLDFTAVTDHAEFLGVLNFCQTKNDGAPRREPYCLEIYRPADSGRHKFSLSRAVKQCLPFLKFLCFNEFQESPRLGNRELMFQAAQTLWEKSHLATENANDRCHFTAFNGYEWTAAPGGQIHRNVIFSGEQIPDVPFDAFDYPTPRSLWAALDNFCKDKKNCETLTIPHNSNLSNGFMFSLDGLTQKDLERKDKLERLVEIFQSKGSSECLNPNQDDISSDDCNFEIKLVGNQKSSWQNLRSGYVRSGLEEGLLNFKNIGFNPFQLGFVGATDSHTGTPGFVVEKEFNGAFSKAIRLTEPGLQTSNPGGLTGIWAEENTRESLFEALKRREAYATSGPRIILKFFQVWDSKPSHCSQSKILPDTVMGGSLNPSEHNQKPKFVIQALKDSVNFERADIIKSSIGNDGKISEAVISFPAKDLDRGDPSLCIEWIDKNYEPSIPTFWYARVIEKSSPRWSVYACATLEKNNPNFHCDPKLKTNIQERAWASPIWNLPKN